MRTTPYRPPLRTTPGILFAEDFDAEPRFDQAGHEEPPPEPPPLPPPGFSAEELEQACAAARETARREALQEAEELHRVACRDALEQIVRQFQVADKAAADVMEEAVEAAGRLVFSCLQAALPETCARHDAKEIIALVRRLMAGLSPVPVVDIAVAPGLEASLRATLRAMPAEIRPAVRLTGRAGLPYGDAKITWKSGAVSRSRSHVMTEIDRVLNELGLTITQAPEMPDVKALPTNKIMETVDA